MISSIMKNDSAYEELSSNLSNQLTGEKSND